LLHFHWKNSKHQQFAWHFLLVQFSFVVFTSRLYCCPTSTIFTMHFCLNQSLNQRKHDSRLPPVMELSPFSWIGIGVLVSRCRPCPSGTYSKQLSDDKGVTYICEPCAPGWVQVLAMKNWMNWTDRMSSDVVFGSRPEPPFVVRIWKRFLGCVVGCGNFP